MKYNIAFFMTQILTISFTSFTNFREGRRTRGEGWKGRGRGKEEEREERREGGKERISGEIRYTRMPRTTKQNVFALLRQPGV